MTIERRGPAAPTSLGSVTGARLRSRLLGFVPRQGRCAMVQRFPTCRTGVMGFSPFRPSGDGGMAALPLTSDLRRHCHWLPGPMGVGLSRPRWRSRSRRSPFSTASAGMRRSVATLLTAASAIVAWNLLLIARARRTRPGADTRDRPSQTALRPGVRTGLGAALLGMVLASGTRLPPLSSPRS